MCVDMVLVEVALPVNWLVVQAEAVTWRNMLLDKIKSAPPDATPIIRAYHPTGHIPHHTTTASGTRHFVWPADDGASQYRSLLLAI